MKRRFFKRIVLSAALVLAPAAGGFATVAQAKAVKSTYQYAAKLLCSGLGTFGDDFLATGTYRTAVNIHNPTDAEITIAHKVVIASGLDQAANDSSIDVYRSVTFAPQAVASVSCFDIFGFFCPTPDGICFDFSALDGYLIINSPVQLDVDAIYTARHQQSEVQTMEVEKVRGRKAEKTIEVTERQEAPEIKERKRWGEN